MSQIYKLSNGGGGGGVETLTPDEGGAVSPTAGTIPVLGYQANTVETMRTYNDGAGNLRIADQTWQTQYVVDSSTTDGLKGTFTTINDAITQAIADGNASSSEVATIFIRPGTYAEDISLPSLKGLRFVGVSFEDAQAAFPIGVTIDGEITFNANSIGYFENVVLSPSSGQEIINNGSVICSFTDCTIFNPLQINAGTIRLVNTLGGGAGTISGGGLAALNCDFASGSLTLTNVSDILFDNCRELNITLNDSSFTAYTCSLMTITGNASLSTSRIIDSDIRFNPVSSLEYSNLNLGDPSFTAEIFGSNVTPLLIPCTAGNVIQTTLVDDDYTALRTDYYIGVTDTTAARTITLPDTSNTTLKMKLNQIMLIKDESGGATTNNITVSPNGGTIDGAASYVINTNYGFVEIKFNGTNYFVIRTG